MNNPNNSELDPDAPMYVSKEARSTSPRLNLRPDIWTGDIHPEYIRLIVEATINDVKDLINELEKDGNTEALTELEENIHVAFCTMAAIRTAQRLAMELDGIPIESQYDENGNWVEEDSPTDEVTKQESEKTASEAFSEDWSKGGFRW